MQLARSLVLGLVGLSLGACGVESEVGGEVARVEFSGTVAGLDLGGPEAELEFIGGCPAVRAPQLGFAVLAFTPDADVFIDDSGQLVSRGLVFADGQRVRLTGWDEVEEVSADTLDSWPESCRDAYSDGDVAVVRESFVLPPVEDG